MGDGNGEDSGDNADYKEAGDDSDSKKSSSSIRVMLKLLYYCKPDTHLWVIGFTFLIISSTTVSFVPYYTGKVIDNIAINRSTSAFEQAIAVMAVITIVSAVSAGLRGAILIIAYGRLTVRIRRVLFSSLLHQEIGFFDQVETGDLTSRLTADTTKMADQIGLNLNLLLRNLVQFIGALVFMIKLTWKLSLVTVVGIPLITVVTWYFGDSFKVRKPVNSSRDRKSVV